MMNGIYLSPICYPLSNLIVGGMRSFFLAYYHIVLVIINKAVILSFPLLRVSLKPLKKKVTFLIAWHPLAFFRAKWQKGWRWNGCIVIFPSPGRIIEADPPFFNLGYHACFSSFVLVLWGTLKSLSLSFSGSSMVKPFRSLSKDPQAI